MKIGLHKLKYTIWRYFILFALGLMCIVWFIQIVFTEQYFLNDMKSQMITSGEAIELKYNLMVSAPENVTAAEDFAQTATSIKEIDNIYVIVSTRDYNGTVGEELPKFCYPVESTVLEHYYNEFGDVIRQVKEYTVNEKNGYTYSGTITSNENKTDKLYVYSKIISEDKISNDSVYIILISSLGNVTKMLSIIQQQLGVITIVIIVVAFFVSWVISSNLSKPLVNMNKTAKKLANGNFGVQFTASGYSEISELTDTLNYMKEEVKKTSVLQRELLANVTHDLKTPLTMVKAYAEMIQDISGENKAKRDKHAQVIIDEADRLTMLVNDILNLSKVQSSVDGLEIQRVNLSLLTGKVIDHFGSFLENNGYLINATIEENLYCECDVKKIEQVIYNLIGNAINYTGENKTVEVFLTKNKCSILFEVIDSGKGIDAEKIETIWEKYYRASETHKRPVKGTGLGLSIVKAVLEAHNLKYGVVSKKDVGSNFFVEFPLVEGDQE